MKKSSLLLISLLLVINAFSQHSPWRPGEMEIKIRFKTFHDARLLGNLQLNTDIGPSGAYAYVVPSELNKIETAGLDYEILKPDLNAWSASFGDALVPNGYYTFNEIEAIADSLVTAFPSICKKVVFGQSASFQELAALKISDHVDIDENEAEILFDGGIHGDEVGGSQNVIMFARDLCRDYGTNPDITDLIDNREIWLYYCVNPWGRNNMTRYNSNGIDINRDFGYMWGYEGGSMSPFSQPETKALRSCKLDNQFTVYTNYHSGIEIISYPWSNRVTLAPDKAAFNALAQVYSNNSGYSSLPYGQGALIMYLIQGSTKDFDYGSLGSVGWSIEISNDKQPAGSLIQYFYDVNKPAMLALIEHCGYGVQGTVTDAITGEPVAAVIFEGDNYPSYSDPVVGDYHRYLIPDTYTLKVAANGYAPKTISGVTVTNGQCTTTDVQLQPLAGHYAFRVISSHIPNFDGFSPGDEGYSAACLMAPDQVSYSLGKGGYIIVDMQDTLYNTDGPDVTVYEGDGSPEGFSLYAGSTMDGPWINLGSGSGTTSFDMGTYSVNQARYFKIADDNNGSANIDNAGFELDAIASLHPQVPDTVGHLSGTLYNGETGLPIANGLIFSGDSTCYSNGDGLFSMDLLRGDNIVWAVAESYGPRCDTLFLAPATITTHDFVLYPNVGTGMQPVTTPVMGWPNPVTDEITIRFDLSGPQQLQLKIVNSEGKVCSVHEMKPFSTGKQQVTINFAEEGIILTPGFYTIVIDGPSYHKCLKMMKSN